MPGGTVSAYDPDLHEPHRKLEAIEARMAALEVVRTHLDGA